MRAYEVIPPSSSRYVSRSDKRRSLGGQIQVGQIEEACPETPIMSQVETLQIDVTKEVALDVDIYRPAHDQSKPHTALLLLHFWICNMVS